MSARRQGLGFGIGTWRLALGTLHFAPKESVDGFFRYDEYVWSLWQKWTLVWIADSPLSAGHVVQFWFDKDHIHVLLRSQ